MQRGGTVLKKIQDFVQKKLVRKCQLVQAGKLLGMLPLGVLPLGVLPLKADNRRAKRMD